MGASLEDIRELREMTSCGVIDCKKALEEAKGDMKKAQELLQKRGLEIAAKKSSRAALNGRLEAYVHMGNKIAVLVQVNCETDFVAKNSDFCQFAKDLAMHIAATAPMALSEATLDPAVVERELAVQTAKALEENASSAKPKPEQVIQNNIIPGRMKKFLAENTLLGQAFVINPDVTVEQAAKDAGVEITGFARVMVGEGVEKEKEDFAAEVAKALQG